MTYDMLPFAFSARLKQLHKPSPARDGFFFHCADVQTGVRERERERERERDPARISKLRVVELSEKARRIPLDELSVFGSAFLSSYDRSKAQFSDIFFKLTNQYLKSLNVATCNYRQRVSRSNLNKNI